MVEEPAAGGAAPADSRKRRPAHPMVRLAGTVARLPRYVNLAQGLLRDPQVPAWRKAALGAGVAYAVSPIDLVPGIIPVAGQMDDLFVLLSGLRIALGGCPPEAAARHMERVGLSPGAVDADTANARGAARWLAGSVARLAGRSAAFPVRAIRRIAKGRAHVPLPGRTAGNAPPSNRG